MIAGTAAIIGVIYGYDLGSIASATLFLKPDLGLSTFMVSVVTATVVLGQLLGAFSAGRITNSFGRKRTMVFVAPGYAGFAALQGLAPETEGRQLESIRQYWYNGGKWPEGSEARRQKTHA